MFDLRNRSHFKTKKERNIPFYICFQEHCCFTHDASIRENSIFACVLFGYEGQVRKRHRFIMDITWKERDLQGLNPSEWDVEGSDDDKISIHVKTSQRSDQNTCRYVEFVVPWRPHVHHRCVGVLVLRPPRL